jgi:hypothetical protein
VGESGSLHQIRVIVKIGINTIKEVPQLHRGLAMPINKKKMNALKKQYGAKEGEDIYYKLENKAKAKKKKKHTKKKKKKTGK